ncbi:acetyltransferase [Halobacteriales archaeon SW_7_68_16]|nr:MAG: acetyltransferase [Halobacteriales archaeon SW_7_68_16]
MTKRYVTPPAAAETGLAAFVDEVDDRLSGAEDTAEVVRDVLVELNGDRAAYDRWAAGSTVSSIEEARLLSYDPRNVTLESEYYAEKDEAAFAESKPLQVLWRGFDRTPMADNIAFALAFREMLADHLFAEAGDDLRLFGGITVTYGHNIELGDNVVIHDDVHVDDRGAIEIGDGVSMADGTHVYSHDHDLVDQTTVYNYRTTIADDARLTFDSMVRAGCRVGENALVGARTVVQGDVPAHHVAVGTPAESVKIKPGWEEVADPLSAGGEDRREERRIEYELGDDPDRFDEFERDLHPPGD